MKEQIELFRKVHPKATKNLSDEEVLKLGDMIEEIHKDKTPRKFKDVFTTPEGESFLIADEDGKPIAIPLMQSGKKGMIKEMMEKQNG